MEKILKEKLAQDMPIYQQEEILWMLDHVGHPNYKIRDDLIFVSLARAIQEQLFTKDQFDFVVVEALKRQGLLYKKEEVGQATLIRSFTALLFANLLNADAKKIHFILKDFLVIKEWLYLNKVCLIYCMKMIALVILKNMVGCMPLLMVQIF
ncbi:hypothetical protein HMPREF1514_0876 [Streptococcus sp. AS20]|nr:hypothetical protein HMPREF1514_0876 [Streptococcus sp. AS20]